MKETIRSLYELELVHVMSQKIIEELDAYAKLLGSKETIEPPYYKEPDFVSIKIDTDATLARWSMVGAVIGAIPGWLEGCEEGRGSIDLILTVPLGIVIYGFIGLAIGFIVGLFISAIKNHNANEKSQELHEIKRKEAKSKYSEEYRNYKRRYDLLQKKYNNEVILKNRIEQEKQLLVEALDNSKKQLRQYYDFANIHEEYRNVVAMGYMYELAKIKAAYQLEGQNGLYFLVRKELREDRLLNAVLGVSYKIDTIIDQNNRLYNEVRKLNSESYDVYHGIIEYNKRKAQQNAKELSDSFILFSTKCRKKLDEARNNIRRLK